MIQSISSEGKDLLIILLNWDARIQYIVRLQHLILYLQGFFAAVVASSLTVRFWNP
jgi:hypothetical protein